MSNQRGSPPYQFTRSFRRRFDFATTCSGLGSCFYDKPNDGLSKNDHFGDLLRVAQDRGFTPECVLFDGWYSSLENLKRLQTLGWPWLARLKSNRRANPERTGLRAVSACDIAATGTVVHWEGYGLIKVFRIVTKDGTLGDERPRTGRTGAIAFGRRQLADRGVSPGLETGDECGTQPMPQGGGAQRSHIGLALRAFLVIEKWCFHTGMNWLSAKWGIVRDAIRTHPPRSAAKPRHCVTPNTLRWTLS